MTQASNELLLSYYGDDLTGSTDVMEAMASNGVDTVLFMNVPDEKLLSRFSHCKAIGLAGTSRSETPEWMQEYLTPAFNWLKSLNAAITHYKVCSTFDSAPRVGSIGKAVEIGKAIFDQAYVPLVVGAPQLKRYTTFGNLFAAYQGEVYRIDRHPVMSRHPVTPMHEADLREHLAKQTVLKAVLADLATLSARDADYRVNAIAKNADGMLLFDVDSHESQLQAGQQLWRLRPDMGWFVAGSSGVEYALRCLGQGRTNRREKSFRFPARLTVSRSFLAVSRQRQNARSVMRQHQALSALISIRSIFSAKTVIRQSKLPLLKARRRSSTATA